MMTKTRDSYNLDLISQQIAEAALIDQSHARQSWQSVIRERERLRASLSSLGLASPRSQSNFLLVTVPSNGNCDAATLYQRLRERHILVRHFDTPGLRDKLRISVGTEEENAQLEAVIAELLS